MEEQKLQEMERQVEVMQQRIDRLERKKRRKPWKIVLIVLGVIVILFVVLFGALFVAMGRDKESPALAERVIQSVAAQDADGAYALMYPDLISREEFEQGFDQMCRAWTAQGGSETFQMKQTRWLMENRNGVVQYTTEYTVTSGQAQFQFSLVRMVQGDKAGVVSAYLGQSLPG